ncbi:chemokine-like protein TAFA-5 [Erethizon dorsatum]
MQLLKALWALAGAALCCFLVLVIHAQFLKEGQLAAGTCEIVTLDRDSSQPRRTIARQTARCACRKGQIAGTTRARPACVDARIIRTKQWCDMLPCLEGEGCDLLINRSGWTCTQPGGRIKTTTGCGPSSLSQIRWSSVGDLGDRAADPEPLAVPLMVKVKVGLGSCPLPDPVSVGGERSGAPEGARKHPSPLQGLHRPGLQPRVQRVS